MNTITDGDLQRHTPRRLTVLVPVLALILIALCGLFLIGLGMQRVGVTAMLIGVAASLVPVGIVVAGLLWVDRWEPEPGKLLLLAFLWGACVATIIALLMNDTAAAIGNMLLERGNGSTLSTIVSAPVVEEAAKGAFLLILLFWRSREFDGVVDGIVYAGFAAAGFAFTENISYFGRAFVEYGIGAADNEGFLAVFILRGVLAPFTHPLFTVLTGIGIGVAAVSGSHLFRILAPLGGYFAAVCLHMLWNGAATLGGATDFLNVYFLIMVPIFVGMLMLVLWQRRREQRIIAASLPLMASERWIAKSEVDLLASLAGRRAWRRQAGSESGRKAARAVRAYQAAVTELAFLLYNRRSGNGGKRKTELLDVVRATRMEAVRLAAARRQPSAQ